MATFILIHGAWHGAWCWQALRASLTSGGHQVIAPDLPGHGEDPTALGDVTLEAYIDRAVATVEAAPAKPILLGHSMGGMVVSGAAERIPDRLAGIVYLAAFVPADGESLLALGAANTSALTGNQTLDKASGSVTVNDSVIERAFYHDCESPQIAEAKSRLQPQAMAPFSSPVALSDPAYGRVRRCYIECIEDQAIHIAHQRFMAERAGCEPVYRLETGHSPFLSDPAGLADVLADLADEWADG